MGFLDRFKKKSETIGKEKKPKHIVTKKAKADEEKRRQFAAVPAAGADRERPAQKPEDAKKEKAPPARSAKLRKEDTGDAYRVLVREVVSEKSTLIGGQRHVFVVSTDANKISVRKAIRSLYGVEPQKVNILNVRGKHLRYGRTQGRTKRWKKAIITLHQGQALSSHGG